MSHEALKRDTWALELLEGKETKARIEAKYQATGDLFGSVMEECMNYGVEKDIDLFARTLKLREHLFSLLLISYYLCWNLLFRTLTLLF